MSESQISDTTSELLNKTRGSLLCEVIRRLIFTGRLFPASPSDNETRNVRGFRDGLVEILKKAMFLNTD